MVCSKCGFVESELMHGYSCPSCGSMLSSQPENTYQPASPNKFWETLFSREFPLSSFLLTVKNILFKPDSFFKQLSPTNNSLSAWLFALIAGSIGYTLMFAWSYFFPDTFSEMYDDTESFFSGQGNSLSETLLFTPLIISFKLFIITLYIHTMLTITHSKKNTIKSTFKIVSYSQSAMLLHAIPALGTFISSVYMCLLLLVGVQEIHHISKVKTFFILFSPIILLLVFIVIALLFMIVLGMSLSSILNDLTPFLNH